VAANAGIESLKPHFYVDAHLATQFEQEAEGSTKAPSQQSYQEAVSFSLR
jgi:hypothetical protein